MPAGHIRVECVVEVMASLFVTKLVGCKGKSENETSVTKYDASGPVHTAWPTELVDSVDSVQPTSWRQSTIPYIRSPASPSPGTM